MKKIPCFFPPEKTCPSYSMHGPGHIYPCGRIKFFLSKNLLKYNEPR
ncbi:hypothetical protein B4135_3888 [Caldibacillus debilis]|uniref:Uncharacterized protein n=1 Tax=Caldibacillus debilis TaxID=301148 RepID=A0A150L9J0_9BACI|nr:hypothetical protein B4135_3888 [Caldibacillus debilis]